MAEAPFAPRFIFVTGGVVSSLGKGIVTASLGKLLQSRGYKVTAMKFDPYLNVDPGTLNPYEHGEVYVTEDGAETDMDLGHYERFLNITTTRHHNITTGKIYQQILEKERQGIFLGKTVQVIPHVTDEIKKAFTQLTEKEPYEIILIELGGTVGDIESLPYIEAARQLHYELGSSRVLFAHLTLIVHLKSTDELKTKPTQHSVKALQQAGVQPDILICRTEKALPREVKHKIALLTNVPKNAVIEARDAENIYQAPFLLRKEKLDEVVLRQLRLPLRHEPDLSVWQNFLHHLTHPKTHVHIGIIGKYVELKDAYKSIQEALYHAAGWTSILPTLHWIHSEDITPENVNRLLSPLQGAIVAPGFGGRGLEGKIQAIQYLRENGLPFLGICLGMQMAIVEWARNVAHLKNAHTTEIQPDTPHPVLILMEDQKNASQIGGTMRLGSFPCEIKKGTLAYKLYQGNLIYERHRHRYEVNPEYLAQFESQGLIVSGVNPKNKLTEIIEVPSHPFFIGVQFHPEFRSRIEKPHPLFIGLLEAASKIPH